MTQRFAWVLSGMILAIGGCADGSDTPTESGVDFAAFDEALSSFLAEEGLAGATSVVVHRDHGIMHVRGYGEFAQDRIALVASSSKVLSAGILMSLVDDALLDPDLPVSEYLGDWGEHKTDVTTSQLLSNSSGLPGLLDDPLYGPYLCQFLDGGSLKACAEAIYTADDAGERSPPDTAFRYGGGQWQLAGGIAEVVSGMRWDELVDRTYVVPCGLEATGYGNHFMRATVEGGGDVDAGFDYPSFFDGDPSNLDATENPSVEGGAYTTAEDYGRILLMHLRGGECDGTQVLSTASVERMQRDRIGEVYGGTTIDPSLPGYGFGWWLDRDNPGIVADGGAYGSMPWLDLARGYGAMIILEGEATQGPLARIATKPALDAIFDELLED